MIGDLGDIWTILQLSYGAIAKSARSSWRWRAYEQVGWNIRHLDNAGPDQLPFAR
jgi:hypothetical protein